MKLQSMQEGLLASVLIVLAILLLNPFHFWMPAPMTMLLIALSIIVFGVFIAFVWRERVRDERESAHKSHAGWYAYLAGAAMLMIGIAVQSFMHTLDPWLVGALATMLLVKMAARMYADHSF